ncbi:mechanosensitive ion channel family protein [Leptolyngbya sp. AN02str]|uniref:mechanosensitive ion channel family protein n=1 Tax=Leptolyngbya sp. AN02str TaxID=3423363 RepID=UPI003D320400
MAINWDSVSALLIQLQSRAVEFGLRLVAAIAILVVGRWIAKQLRRTIKRAISRTPLDPNLVSFTSNLAEYGITAFVILAVLGQLGIETTSLLAVLGAAGLAVGLALQGSLSNFAAGLLIVFFHPFRVGDWIEGAGETGFVEDIQLLTTVIRTPDNRTVIIPNNNLMTNNIINYSAKGVLRMELVVGVAYSEDLDRVKAVIAQALEQDERILRDPEPVIGVMALADSSVNFTVRPWVRPEHYWPAYFAAYENIKKHLDAAGISIPFPQRDVYLYQRSERI